MATPREISSAGQGRGAMTPGTAHVVSKAAGVAHIEGATPRAWDDEDRAPRHASTSSPWANLSVETEAATPDEEAEATTADAEMTGAMDEGSSCGNANPNNKRKAKTSTTTNSNVNAAVPPGVLPERYTADLVHWQSPVDLPERRLMVQRIIAMTRSKRLETGLPGALASEPGVDRTPSLAKRIELSLYSRAASFNEYKDLNTLRRRLQSLVSLSFHEAAATRLAAQTHKSSLGKRHGDGTAFGVARLMIKRRRLGTAPPEMEMGVATPAVVDIQMRETFFIMDEDVLRQVFSFLPGTETIRCFTINRFAARVLPRCVLSLQVEIRQMQAGFANDSPNFMGRFSHLEALTVFNKDKPCDLQEAGPSLHAWGCSELDISHDNIGETVVKQLAESIELGACRRLKALRLVSVFTNTCRGNALHALCAALVKGSCPDLEDLLLGGNGFSDVGTVDIAWLLRVGSLPNLSRLDIRRNYVGESGLKRIMAALAAGRCQNLKHLCMGGNIITDHCVAPVVDLLSRSLCPQMRFLGLEDNFLSARGVHSIIEAAVAGGMMPKLHHVSSDGRSDDSAEDTTP